MKTVAITGMSGVVGRVLAETAPKHMVLIDLFHETQYTNNVSDITIVHKHTDLLSGNSLNRALDSIHPDIIIHLAAITHIDTCERDKKHGKEGIVWKLNVEGQKHVTAYCKKNSVPLVYLSTECVFDGKKTDNDEFSKKNPKNWYGRTKHEAEELMLSSGVRSSLIRTVMAYHKNDLDKTIFGKFLSLLKRQQTISVVTDQQFSPTYTYDITRAIWSAVQNKIFGIFHVIPDISLSPYDFCSQIAKRYICDSSLIKPVTMETFFGKERAALRLIHSCLTQTYSNRKLGVMPQKPSDAFSSMGA